MLHLVCAPIGCNAAGNFYDKALAQGYHDAMLVTASRPLVGKARQYGVNAAGFDYLANDILRHCGLLGAKKISRCAQELIIREILEKLLREGKLVYFADMISKKGFLHSMTALMDQIGSCGATPEEIETAFSHWDGRASSLRRKDAEVAAIFREYLSYLIKHNLFDVQGLYRMAAEELSKLEDASQVLPWKTLYFTGFYQFDALQTEIVHRLSQCIEVWVALPYETTRPELYGVTEFTYGSLMGYAVEERAALPVKTARTASLEYLLQNLRNPGRKAVPVDGSIEIWQAADKTEEVRNVLREIKLQIRDCGIRPDEVAVVVRRMDDYTGIRALCDEYGIPVQMADNALLSANPVFRYVISVLQLVTLGGREKTEACIGFLSLPLQRFVLGLEPETVSDIVSYRYYTDSGEVLEKVVAACPEGDGVQRLWQVIGQIPDKAPVREFSDRITVLLDSLDLFHKAGQAYRQGEITLKEFKNITCAAESLKVLLQQLPLDYQMGGLSERPVSCSDFAEALAMAAKGGIVSLCPENKEGIAVLSAVETDDTAFRQVYVLGLQENRFPFLKHENWIYNDRERVELASLGILLPCSSDGYKEDIHFFANTCAAATERMVLSFSTEEDRMASPYIGELLALFTGLKIQEKNIARTMADCLSREELEVSLARQGLTGWLEEVAGPELVEAGKSDGKRIKNEAGWNGVLEEEGLVRLLAQHIGNRFSASGLETYRGCPFRFLALYGWRQKETEAAGEDVTPMQKGNLLHMVLERFINRHLNGTLSSSQGEALQAELDRIFADVVGEMDKAGDLYAGEFWNQDKRETEINLQRWLKKEIEYSETGSFRPVYTEKEFGMGGHEGIPFELEGGERIFLNGKIDRIDRDGNAFYITDYKSGKVPSQSDFLDGDLQMPLYILAAEEILAGTDRAEVIGGGYYALKEGERKSSFRFPDTVDGSVKVPWKTWSKKKDKDGNGEVPADSAALRKAVKELLSKMLRDLRGGRFTPTPEKECMKTCPVAKICRFDLVSQESCEEETDGCV